MTPLATNWRATLGREVHWTIAYPAVEEAVVAYLTAHPGRLSTGDLVEALWPAADAARQGADAIWARRRIFKALMALAPRGLADFAHKGDIPRRMGKTGIMVSPWLWEAPPEYSSFTTEKPTHD